MFLSIQEHSKLISKSQAVLKRLQNNENLKKLEESKRIPTSSFSRIILEEFDESSFVDKIKMDNSYYNVLINKIDENIFPNIQENLSDLLKVSKQIYEHLNIKPKIYGFNRLVGLDEPDNIINESATKVINDYINNNYYKLTSEQRYEKYHEIVQDISKEFVISENVDIVNSVEYATKTAVIYNLIENINFPLVIKSEIEKSLTSDEYGELFEQEQLSNLWDSFKSKNLVLSKIIAAYI